MPKDTQPLVLLSSSVVSLHQNREKIDENPDSIVFLQYGC